jgi:nicotinamide-nucleotide amidase
MMVGEVAAILREQALTLAVAESCTGGRLAAAFTAEAGASDYFPGGVVAYSNDVKTNVLGVRHDVLTSFGAGSREVAEQMAEGTLRVFGADFAIATTGIAGPGGGTPEKLVGTVWVAVAGPGGVSARLFHFDGKTRAENMERAVAAAVGLLKKKITLA